MILITGGVYQGKKAFAHTLSTKAPIVDNLHLHIRKALEEGKNPREEVERLLADCPDGIITVAELGCGIVPMDAFERNYREMVGRICCELAQKAEAVYRVNCGIGVRIK